MNLERHYHQMWTHSSRQFDAGRFEYDALIDNVKDMRRGITLLARPSERVRTAVENLLHDLRTTEPQQYYYPNTDIHLTVLSIISCYEGFSLNLIDPAAYTGLVQEVLHAHSSFKIHFSGLTASPSCLLVQGFPLNNELKKIRDDLRKRFRASCLQHSIDKRYSIQTAHSTILRFKAPLSKPAIFLQKIREFRDIDFGTFEVNELELVFNDWYQRAENTVLLGKYTLDSRIR